MNNKKIFIILSVFLFFSCVKVPKINTPVQDDTNLKVPLNFDWNILKTQELYINETSDILNSNGDTIASALSAGKYNFIIAKNDNLIAKKTQTETKAPIENKRVFYPNSQNNATIIFEDTFPYNGDMDMNDLFFAFRIEYFLTSPNTNSEYSQVHKIKIHYAPRAIGSGYSNFSIAAKLDIDPTKYSVNNVSNQNLGINNNPLFKVNKNGVEEGIEGSIVVPISNDIKGLFRERPVSMANVYSFEKEYRSDTYNMTIIFSKPYPNYSSLMYNNGLRLFAVFGERDREIFVKGSTPTSKFNNKYFKELDNTDFSRKNDNTIWAIDVPIEYETKFYPSLENVLIYDAYPRFRNWVESNGTKDIDWYNTYIPDNVFIKKY